MLDLAGDLAALEAHLADTHGIRFDKDDEDRTIEGMRFFHMEDHSFYGTGQHPMGDMPKFHTHNAPL